MPADLPLIPLAPPSRETAASSLLIMAHINRLQSAAQLERGQEFMARYHAAVADDFEQSAGRLSAASESPKVVCLKVTDLRSDSSSSNSSSFDIRP